MSNETKTQVTFGKVEREDNYYATTAIYSQGAEVGYISTNSGSSGAYTQRFKGNVRVTSYAVNIFPSISARFNVADYSSARSALAAAKRYVKETLSAPAPVEETRVDEINGEIKQLRASAASVKDVEEDILELERERADLLYGTVETPAPVETHTKAWYQIDDPCFEYNFYTKHSEIIAMFTRDAGARVIEYRAQNTKVNGLYGELYILERHIKKPGLLRIAIAEALQGMGVPVKYVYMVRNAKAHAIKVILKGCAPTPNTYKETPAPVEAPEVEEEARCYHVTRCKFDPRGNPSVWSTDSSYTTLEEARARCAELVAELGGEVDPSSLSAHSCETVGDVGVQLVYDTLPARDNTKTYIGAHNGAYLYETSQEPEVEEEALEPLVKGFSSPAPEVEEEASSQEPEVEEEARVIRVTPPQVDALRALGYPVKSCKLRYYPSQVEELLERLYAERETRTRGARRVYTSLIERVSAPKSQIKRAKGAPRAFFNSGDLRIEYTSDSAHRQLMQLIDAAESTGLISGASARTLRASTYAPRVAIPEVEEESGSSALARFMGR